MTSASAGIDDLTHVGDKTTTTVAMDFGRITLRRRPDPVPVRHARPGPVLVHVGRPGARRHRRRWSWSTPAGWPTASPRSTTSRTAGCRSSSRSTASTGTSRTARTRSGRRCRSAPRPRSSPTDARHRADAKSALITLVEHALMARLRAYLAEPAASRASPSALRAWEAPPGRHGWKAQAALAPAPSCATPPCGRWAAGGGFVAGCGCVVVGRAVPRALWRSPSRHNKRGLRVEGLLLPVASASCGARGARLAFQAAPAARGSAAAGSGRSRRGGRRRGPGGGP